MGSLASGETSLPSPAEHHPAPEFARGHRAALTQVEFREGGVELDAEVIAHGLGLQPSGIPALMRCGEITSLCERGTDQDAGRYRLTFFHKSRRFRFVVETTGRVIQRGVIDFGDRALPPSLRKPSA